MQPVYRRVIVVREPLADGRGRERGFVFADVRGDDGLGVHFVVAEAVQAVVGLGEEVGSFMGALLEVGGRWWSHCCCGRGAALDEVRGKGD